MAKFTARFDDAVIRALDKWPNVPQCFGWLHLDRRGNWLIKNEIIRHPRAVAFIARHFSEDDHGRWFVQNGPQRVFCSLAYTPLIFRLQADHTFVTHTNRDCENVERLLLDDRGNILLLTDLGIGIVDDRDLVALSMHIESPIGDAWFDYDQVSMLSATGQVLSVKLDGRTIPLDAVRADSVATRFGFQPEPAALPSERTS